MLNEAETVTFPNPRGRTLVGEWREVGGDRLIVLMHGLTADRFERGRFDLAVSELTSHGFNTFRFDFAGCGESDDGDLTLVGLLEDGRSALQFARHRGGQRFGLLGLSFGAYVCCRMEETVEAMVLWAPVTNRTTQPARFYGPDKAREVQETGKLTHFRDNLPRWVTIDGSLLADWESIDQESLLSRIRIPVLIAHGRDDDKIPIADSRNALDYLPKGSTLTVIDGADHHLKTPELEEFVRVTVDWFEGHFV